MILRAPEEPTADQIASSASWPVVFLAGPIQQAGDWQDQAALLFEEAGFPLLVANPRRDLVLEADLDPADYERQVNWESRWLGEAARRGVILFWMARGAEERSGRAYAQTTRFELAEWVTRAQYEEGIKIVAGAEQGFSGRRYIAKRLAELERPVPVLPSLEETVACAIERLSNNNS